MRANHLQECLRKHKATRVTVEEEAEGGITEPEGRERYTKEKREDGGGGAVVDEVGDGGGAGTDGITGQSTCGGGDL